MITQPRHRPPCSRWRFLSALENGTDRHTWRRPTDEQVAYFQSEGQGTAGAPPDIAA
ncbi:MAG: hypothetical protein ACRDS1_14600 [Pseudonocardiaceae bacterium]